MSVQVLQGDCIQVMKSLKDSSVDAIVTDPPYGLEFMGKTWDGSDGFRRSLNPADAGRENVFGRTSKTSPEYRVTGGVPQSGRRPVSDQPGAHDEGYRNMRGKEPVYQQWCQVWAEECLRVLKPGGHLLAFGGTRTYHRMACAIEDAGFEIRDSLHWIYGSGFPKSMDVSKAIDKVAGVEREVIGIHRRHGGGSEISGSMSGPLGTASELPLTTPSTEEATRWAGWGTALKPSHEPIVVARKPLIGTVAANVLKYGTGGLNIDATRVEGRWPPNILLTHSADCTLDCAEDCPVAEMDRQSGVSASRIGKPRRSVSPGDGYGMVHTGAEYDDTGGSSRFFPCFRYQAKAAKKERPSVEGVQGHPTIKPVELMRWLVRLVTPTSVTIMVCSNCGEELPGVWRDVPTQAQRSDIVRPAVQAETGRAGTQEAVGSMSGMRQDATGRSDAEVLQHGMFGNSTQETENLHHLRDELPGASTDATDVFARVCSEGGDTSPQGVRNVQRDVSAQIEQEQILFTEMLGQGERPGETQRENTDTRGIYTSLPPGSPDGEQVRLPSRASQGDGGRTGSDAPVGRGGSPQERHQGRQSPGESGGYGETGARSHSETSTEADSMSPLPGNDRSLGTCPHCGGAIRRSERPGRVLDPFAGSGTTGEACLEEGFNCILIEREPDYIKLINARLDRREPTLWD